MQEKLKVKCSPWKFILLLLTAVTKDLTLLWKAGKKSHPNFYESTYLLLALFVPGLLLAFKNWKNARQGYLHFARHWYYLYISTQKNNFQKLTYFKMVIGRLEGRRF